MTDAPPGLIPIPIKGATLLLTPAEFAAAVARGKSWRLRVSLAQREEHPREADRLPPSTSP